MFSIKILISSCVYFLPSPILNDIFKGTDKIKEADKGKIAQCQEHFGTSKIAELHVGFCCLREMHKE